MTAVFASACTLIAAAWLTSCSRPKSESVATSGGIGTPSEDPTAESSAAPSGSAPAADRAASPQVALIEVGTTLLEYDPQRFWCTYHEEASSGEHSEGRSPWGRFRIESPKRFAGRTFEVQFDCAYAPALIDALPRAVGKAFVLVLPEDFLSGNYTRIVDCDVDTAAAERWHAATERTKP